MPEEINATEFTYEPTASDDRERLMLGTVPSRETALYWIERAERAEADLALAHHRTAAAQSDRETQFNGRVAARREVRASQVALAELGDQLARSQETRASMREALMEAVEFIENPEEPPEDERQRVIHHCRAVLFANRHS